jgi:hypothetical protein
MWSRESTEGVRDGGQNVRGKGHVDIVSSEMGKCDHFVDYLYRQQRHADSNTGQKTETYHPGEESV